MARKVIDIGTVGNDGTGDSIRDSFRKVNDNFQELYSSVGLGDRLTFQSLSDTPNNYDGQKNSILAVNTSETGLAYKKLQAGPGVVIDADSNPGAITITTKLTDIASDTAPNLGGPLNAQLDGVRSPIGNLPDLTNTSEVTTALGAMVTVHGTAASDTSRLAANKKYVDTKLSIYGVDSVDPVTGQSSPGQGVMRGPLVLSRSPRPEDDELWGGMIAATKSYVDTAGFGSSVNLYVSTSGSDYRPNIAPTQHGRSLSYAYRSIQAALHRASELANQQQVGISPNKKILTYNNGAEFSTVSGIVPNALGGTGFAGTVKMKVSAVKVSSAGSLYAPGDIINVLGGQGSQSAQLQVLTVTPSSSSVNTGYVNSLKIVSAGLYTQLPGTSSVATSAVDSNGTGLTVDLEFSIDSVDVVSGGSNYTHNNVVFSATGSRPAVAQALISNGVINSIKILDGGIGYTSVPTVSVGLSALYVNSGNQHSDFSNGILVEGQLIQGQQSKSLARVVEHSGYIEASGDYAGSEVIIVEQLRGVFENNERIFVGEADTATNITVFIESGEYLEDLPLYVPSGVSLVGDDTARVIIKPRLDTPGRSAVSSSVGALQPFGKTDEDYGYYYLTDYTKPFYSGVANAGKLYTAAELVNLNQHFIVDQTVNWVKSQLMQKTSPFDVKTAFSIDLVKSQIHNLAIAVANDFVTGNYYSTASVALQIYQTVVDQQLQLVSVLDRFDAVVSDVVGSTYLAQLYSDLGSLAGQDTNLLNPRQTNSSLQSATSAIAVFKELVGLVSKTIQNSQDINYPKNNQDLDVFVVSSRSAIKHVSIAEFSGFAVVADSTGSVDQAPVAEDLVITGQQINGEPLGGILVDGANHRVPFTVTQVSATQLVVESNFAFRLRPGKFYYNSTQYQVTRVLLETTSSAVLVLDKETQFDSNINAAVIPELYLEDLHPTSIIVKDCDISCDRGYGLLASGFAVAFATNVTTSYCDVGFLARAGARLQARNCANRYGNFGVVADGVDLRVPAHEYTVDFSLEQQVSIVVDNDAELPNKNSIKVSYWQYPPLAGSEIEIAEYRRQAFYNIENVEILGQNFAILHLSRDLAEPVFNNQQVIVRQRRSVLVADNNQPLQENAVSAASLGHVNDKVIDVEPGIVEYSRVVTLKKGLTYPTAKVSSIQPFVSEPSPALVSSTTPFVVNKIAHGLLPGQQIRFDVIESGVLPAGVDRNRYYWVSRENFTADQFSVTSSAPVVSYTQGLRGILNGNTVSGLESTKALHPGQKLYSKTGYVINEIFGSGDVAEVTLADSTLIPRFTSGSLVDIYDTSDSSFGIVGARVISCTGNRVYIEHTDQGFTTGGILSASVGGNLGTDPVIVEIIDNHTVLIDSANTINGVVEFDAEFPPISVDSQGSGLVFGVVAGSYQTTKVAVENVPVPLNSLIGRDCYHAGRINTVISAQAITEETALLEFNSPIYAGYADLVEPAVLVLGIEDRTLQIRSAVSLVEALDHSFVNVGTGSYRETIQRETQPLSNTVPVFSEYYSTQGNNNAASLVQERNSGRVFYVGSDNTGKFAVGESFEVDQVSGTVKLNHDYAITGLSGLGFARGVTINEFSVDDTLNDAAINAVPTEYAIRSYIDRRLGVDHYGNNVDANKLIGNTNSGFVPRNGQLPLTGDLDFNNHRLVNLAQPALGSDAARLDSITLENLKNTQGNLAIDLSGSQPGQLLTTTATSIKPLNVSGDVLISATNDSLVSSIAAGSISNQHVSASAGIQQSKLALQAATTRSNAGAITQADLGIASFDETQFSSDSGWITLRNNGVVLEKLQSIGSKTVLGNPGATAASVSMVGFSTVVADGGAVKKSQFSSQGFLKRVSASGFSDDAHFTVVADDTVNTPNTLVRRDSNGDFAAREVAVSKINVLLADTTTYPALQSTTSSSTAGYTELLGYKSTTAGIKIGAGDTNSRTFYDNTVHEFRNQQGNLSFASLDSSGLNLGTRSITAASLLGVKAITTGGDTVAGTITGQWVLASSPGSTVRGGSRLQATYAADLAEFYQGDQEYETGTVLIFGGEYEVTVTDILGDTRVAGVVSDNAAYSMYGACPGLKNQIALQGRVPVKVIGKICKGDILITSHIQGVATSSHNREVKPGSMIGKALENYNSNTVGIIEVSVGRT